MNNAQILTRSEMKNIMAGSASQMGTCNFECADGDPQFWECCCPGIEHCYHDDQGMWGECDCYWVCNVPLSQQDQQTCSEVHEEY